MQLFLMHIEHTFSPVTVVVVYDFSFSPTCVYNPDVSDYVCDACPEGYEGDKCQV